MKKKNKIFELTLSSFGIPAGLVVAVVGVLSFYQIILWKDYEIQALTIMALGFAMVAVSLPYFEELIKLLKKKKRN